MLSITIPIRQAIEPFYLELFWEPIESPTAARCQPQACRAQNESACRVKEAYKNHHNKY